MISYIPQSVLCVLLLGLVHLVMFCVVVIIRENNYVTKLIVVHQYASTILMYSIGNDFNLQSTEAYPINIEYNHNY